MRELILKYSKAFVLSAFFIICWQALLAATAWSASSSFVSKPGSDTLTINSSADPRSVTVERTGPMELTLTFPQGVLGDGQGILPPHLNNSRYVRNVRVSGDSMIITLGNSGIGFIASPLDQNLTLQIYTDPSGSDWQPPVPRAAPTTAQAPPEQPNIPEENVVQPKPAPAAPQAAGAIADSQDSSVVRGRIAKPMEQSAAPAKGSQAAPDQPVPSPAPEAVLPPPAQAGEQKQAAPGAAQALPAPPVPGAEIKYIPVLPQPGQEVPPGGYYYIPVPSSQIGSAGVGTPATPSQPVQARKPEIPPTVTEPAKPAPQPEAAGTTAETKPAAPQKEAVPEKPKEQLPSTKEPVQTSGVPPEQQTKEAEGKEALPEEQKAEKDQQTVQPPAPPQIAPLDAMRTAAENAYKSRNYPEALKIYDEILKDPELKGDEYQEALYHRAELLYKIYENDLKAGYSKVHEAYEVAFNANTRSSRSPEALLYLGVTDLYAGQMPEAMAYFSVLRKHYPKSEYLPMIHYELGKYFAGRGEHDKAVQEYNTFIAQYPTNNNVKLDAVTSLARSLFIMDKVEEASKIIDYIDKNWQNYYLTAPGFLQIQGDLAYKNELFDQAKEFFLAYYNLEPSKIRPEEKAQTLARLGDTYIHLEQPDAARMFYNQAMTLYPDTEGGLIAKLRLAEQGIYDDPKIEALPKAFGSPVAIKPEEVYQEIIDKYPGNAMAMVARFKLAVWKYYKEPQDLEGALKDASAFINNYPDNELVPKMYELGGVAGRGLVHMFAQQDSNDQIIRIWDSYPILQDERANIPEEDRYMVAKAFILSEGERQKRGIEMMTPFITTEMTPRAIEAMRLTLKAYLEEKRWPDIIDLAAKINKWQLPHDSSAEVAFALAQAFEEQNQTGKSRQLWSKLAADPSLDAQKRAPAMLRQAKDAADRKNHRNAIIFAAEALELLGKIQAPKNDLKEAMNILVNENVAENNIREALRWAEALEKIVSDTDPDWGANQLRLASLYLGTGKEDRWRATLENLRDKKGEKSLEGRMAASELEARRLKSHANKLRDG